MMTGQKVMVVSLLCNSGSYLWWVLKIAIVMKYHMLISLHLVKNHSEESIFGTI